MKIAIVAPCAVPYTVGGAEKLWWGLAAHLNERTRHQAEIIKLPSPEADLVSLIRSYEAFAALDLSGFDAVISGKYPAWMVEHPQHICYMLHRLRGLYDCYDRSPQLAPELAAHPSIAALRGFMARHRGLRGALPEFFGRWSEIVAGQAPPGTLEFPGPLAREMVHWLDDIALAPDRIVRYAAIAQTVADRPGYFPEGVEVAVAHPPPHRAMAPGHRFDHFYTVSRLDGPKRVKLIVEAMRQVKGDVPLLIGGTGPDEAALRAAAGDDSRIRFLGFQSDAEVLEGYQGAIAVPFVPWQEDYGLIAAEALQCGKPVVTATDTGGVRELVDDGVTGFVCEPTPASLAAAMQRLADDRALAREMGRRGIERGARITWEAVAKTLLGDPRPARPANMPRRKLIVANTFPIHPPRSGGQQRSFQIYRALAPEFETVIVSVCHPSQPPFVGEIAPGVREIRIPRSAEHERREVEITVRVGTPVTDVVMPTLHAFTPKIRETIEREARGAVAAVASHPYFQPVLQNLGLPIWYEAQDFELHLKTALFGDREGGEALIETVRAVEGATARAAEVILAASPHDAEQLVKVYGADPARILDVPNGTDCRRIAFSGPEERAALRRKMALPNLPLAFFMGSGHWPNIEAGKRIFEFAAEVRDVAFVFVGSVCNAFDPRMKPPNVLFVGEVDDVTRDLCLHATDVALNPMEHGSGTNIKMLDYFAAGLPVITTESGARGLRLEGETQCLVRPIEEFPAAIREAVGAGAAQAAERAVRARKLVEDVFDWQAIVDRIKPRLVELADARRAEPQRLTR